MTSYVNSGGLFNSIRRLLGTTLDLLQVRLELLGTEVESAKRKLVGGLLWAGLGLLTLVIGLLLVCAFIMILFWEDYRLVSTGLLALFFLMVGSLCLYQSRRRLRSPGGIFAASLEELARDRAALHSGKSQASHEHP